MSILRGAPFDHRSNSTLAELGAVLRGDANFQTFDFMSTIVPFDIRVFERDVVLDRHGGLPPFTNDYALATSIRVDARGTFHGGAIAKLST